MMKQTTPLSKLTPIETPIVATLWQHEHPKRYETGEGRKSCPDSKNGRYAGIM